MFLDDIFIIKMSQQMMNDFIDFGYTLEPEFLNGTFHGKIHRFAIFYSMNTQETTIQTIKTHQFIDDLKGFRKLYEKINKDERYKQFDITEDGKPKLNYNNIENYRFSL
ncbi:MAG: hypothetical protein PHF21_02280 [Bacilli bacterium]|nr:hypothetical protein [Bacilli bacterium]